MTDPYHSLMPITITVVGFLIGALTILIPLLCVLLL